jgi:hypothetical protein
MDFPVQDYTVQLAESPFKFDTFTRILAASILLSHRQVGLDSFKEMQCRWIRHLVWVFLHVLTRYGTHTETASPFAESKEPLGASCEALTGIALDERRIQFSVAETHLVWKGRTANLRRTGFSRRPYI